MYEHDDARYEPDVELGTRPGLSQLQSRYVYPFVLCVFATALLVGTFLTLKSRELLREQLKVEQLASSRAGAQAIGNAVDEFFRLVESVAKSPSVKMSDPGDMRVEFSRAIRHAPAAKALYLFNAKAKLIASTDPDGETVRVISLDQCFDSVRGGATSCFSRMYRTDDGNQRMYVFLPVFSEKGTPNKLLVGGMDIGDKSVQSIVLGLNPGKSGFSMLVDNTGKLVVSGDPDKENSAVRDVSDLQSVKNVLTGKMGSETDKYGKTTMLATFYPVDPMGWGFITQRPLSEASGGVGSLVKIMLLVLVITTAAACALGIMQAQGITRFLFLLGKRMDALASGQRDQTIQADETFGLDRLADSFNRMATMLERNWMDGSRELEDVKKTAQFNAGLLSSIQDIFIVTDQRLKVIIMNEKAEVFVPAVSRPAMGRFLTDLGHAWGQRRLQEAAQKVIESGEVASLSNIRFTTPDRADTAIFDFRIYPVPNTQGVFFYGREVSEFVASVEKVQNSERFFREVATDQADPLVVINKELKVEWINPAASRLLKTEDDFLGVNWMDIVMPGSKDIMTSLLDNAPEDDNTSQAPDEVVIFYNNQKLRIEVSVGRMNVNSEHKYVVTFRMVPSTRLLEREALKNKKKLENKIKFLTCAIESMPEVFAIAGLDGQMIMVNSAFAEMFKEKKEVFVGKKIDVIHAGDGPLVDLSAVALEGFVERETLVKNCKGEKFKAHVIGAAVQNGTHTGYIISVKETETEEKNRIYERRMIETRTRSRMSRTISHKMEEVVGKLGDSLTVLGRNIFADDTREMWHAAMTHCKSLALSVNSLHMYSVDTSISLLVCGIDEIISDTIEQLTMRGMVPHNVTVEMFVQSNCPKMNADADQLRMVVWHVVKNAVEAAGQNEKTGSVLVRAYPADFEGSQSVIVEVLDDGKEFDNCRADHFFEPFYGDKPDGIGLGLTLARRAVVKHCGRIGVLRADGVTRVSFYIPLNLTPKQITRTAAGAAR